MCFFIILLLEVLLICPWQSFCFLRFCLPWLIRLAKSQFACWISRYRPRALQIQSWFLGRWAPEKDSSLRRKFWCRDFLLPRLLKGWLDDWPRLSQLQLSVVVRLKADSERVPFCFPIRPVLRLSQRAPFSLPPTLWNCRAKATLRFPARWF